MAEEEDEAVDQRDLHQDESEAATGEVEQVRSRLARADGKPLAEQMVLDRVNARCAEQL